jgi:hypothetical protein
MRTPAASATGTTSSTNDVNVSHMWSSVNDSPNARSESSQEPPSNTVTCATAGRRDRAVHDDPACCDLTAEAQGALIELAGLAARDAHHAPIATT